MWPFLQDGDFLSWNCFQQPQTASQCQLGEIVLHRDGEEWMAHRVVEVSGRKVLKGDFSNRYFSSSDPVVWAKASSSFTNIKMARLSAKVLSISGLQRKWHKLILCWYGWRLRKEQASEVFSK